MKLQTNRSPILFLLLPSLATALVAGSAPAAADIANTDQTAPVAAGKPLKEPAVAAIRGRYDIPTKDAPVDGKDGKPHSGPFVGTDEPKDTKSHDHEELPELYGKPDDPTMYDGKKIPESNDGVMFDKNRERPLEGTTGTEGGVSEKDKARKAQEGSTGQRVVTQPESPKSHPPIPHSEEQYLRTVDKNKQSLKEKDVEGTKTTDDDEEMDGTDYTGMEKPEDLPETPHDSKQASLPSTPKADSPPPKVDTGKSNIPVAPVADDDDDGISQPFHSFILSFTMILVSEVGDKTFLVAALMAMKHDRMVVFSAAFGALLVMTVLSAVLGHAVPALIPKRLTSFLAAGLFLVFGARLLREGLQMDPSEGVTAEMHEVEQELAEKEKEMGRKRNHSVSADTLEMGLDGRTPRSKNRFPSPARSPSQSPIRSHSPGSGSLTSIFAGAQNLCSLLLSPAWAQTFVMTFLGEWGDRSQIATIAMAAGQDYWWVTLGASCGHAICTGVAVIGGRAIAGRVSLRVVTIGGAVAFLLFAFIYFIEAFYD